MLKIEYEIKLNDVGRPYVELSKRYEDKPEDKFLALELTRYILNNVYQNKTNAFDESTIKKLGDCIKILEQVSDEVGMLLKEQMKTLADISLNFDYPYHIKVKNIKERDNLGYDNILYGDKIYKRIVDLKVLVLNENKVYKLVDGIDNDNWEVII